MSALLYASYPTAEEGVGDLFIAIRVILPEDVARELVEYERECHTRTPLYNLCVVPISKFDTEVVKRLQLEAGQTRLEEWLYESQFDSTEPHPSAKAVLDALNAALPPPATSREVLCVVKTHAVAQWFEIVQALEIIGVRSNEIMVKLNPGDVPEGLMADIYAEHKGKAHYDRLLASVSGELVFIAAHVLDLAKAREAIGPTDPEEARVTAPGSIRAVYGTRLPFNAIHLSDSVETGARELALCREAGVLGAAAPWIQAGGGAAPVVAADE